VRILVLGGTEFVGRAIVDDAPAAGEVDDAPAAGETVVLAAIG
jgi:uncharacterized protein YbjT (DUF2867 family)